MYRQQRYMVHYVRTYVHTHSYAGDIIQKCYRGISDVTTKCLINLTWKCVRCTRSCTVHLRTYALCTMYLVGTYTIYVGTIFHVCISCIYLGDFVKRNYATMSLSHLSSDISKTFVRTTYYIYTVPIYLQVLFTSHLLLHLLYLFNFHRSVKFFNFSIAHIVCCI